MVSFRGWDWELFRNERFTVAALKYYIGPMQIMFPAASESLECQDSIGSPGTKGFTFTPTTGLHFVNTCGYKQNRVAGMTCRLKDVEES